MTSTEQPKVDFDALRAERNKRIAEHAECIAAEFGFEGPVLTSHNPNACYCACPEGPCEHDWTGKEWVSADGCASSVTCARCGTTAMSHDMRTMA
jgi:Zn-finger protein